MNVERATKEIYGGKLEGKRKFRDPRKRWLNEVEEDLKGIEKLRIGRKSYLSYGLEERLILNEELGFYNRGKYTWEFEVDIASYLTPIKGEYLMVFFDVL